MPAGRRISDDLLARLAAAPLPFPGAQAAPQTAEDVRSQLEQFLNTPSRQDKLAAEMTHQPMPPVGTQQTLDTIAAGLGPIPVAGDIAGVGADIHRFITEPESRTPLNYGLAILGGLPFIPPALQTIKMGRRAMETRPFRYRAMFHETNLEAARAIEKEGFNPQRAAHAANDYEIPDGIFLKRKPKRIGVGSEQLLVGLKKGETLEFRDRADLVDFLKRDKEYKRLVGEYKKVEKIAISANKEVQKYMDQAIRNGEVDAFDAAFGFLPETAPQHIRDNVALVDTFMEEGRFPLIKAARDRAREALTEKGVKAIRIAYDEGSGNRFVDTTVLLDPELVNKASIMSNEAIKKANIARRIRALEDPILEQVPQFKQKGLTGDFARAEPKFDIFGAEDLKAQLTQGIEPDPNYIQKKYPSLSKYVNKDELKRRTSDPAMIEFNKRKLEALYDVLDRKQGITGMDALKLRREIKQREALDALARKVSKGQLEYEAHQKRIRDAVRASHER